MQGRGQGQAPATRPYRSHLRPACLACRRRKSRCQSEPSSDVCLMCRAHRSECVFPPGPSSAHQRLPDGGRRRQRGGGRPDTELQSHPSHAQPPAEPLQQHRQQQANVHPLAVPMCGKKEPPASGSHSHEVQDPDITNDALMLSDDSSLALASDNDRQHMLHVIGPTVTSDNQVLSDYLSTMPGAMRSLRMVTPMPASRSQPVLFTKMQKRPLGIPANRSLSAEKLAMIEQLIAPFQADVVDLYFSKVHSSFPLLDENSFRREYRDNQSRISAALLASVYAHATAYWHSSPALSASRCPDTRFIWNLATEALYSELHTAPGMSIIEAILLNLSGRPTKMPIGNAVVMGSAVSIAHCLGLNHDPLPWEIPQSEKNLRMKLWWAILIQDRWTSLAYGTPPHVSRTQYNVPRPAVQYLCDDPSDKTQRDKAAIFVALSTLTGVLDLHLQYFYSFDRAEARSTAHLNQALNSWVESLDEVPRRVIVDSGPGLEVAGSANLRLSYLTVRLLLQRIELEADKASYGGGDDDDAAAAAVTATVTTTTADGSRLASRYLQARTTAEDMLRLTQALGATQLADFWLPTNAFAYTAAVGFLLRCAVETESLAQSGGGGALETACSLVATLRQHREAHAWDLGDICLAQHGEIVDKLQGMMAPAADAAAEDAGAGMMPDLQDFIMPDASFLDQMFPSLWDPLHDSW